MAKKKSSVSSKVHHVHVQHNFSGSAVAVVGGLLLVFALVVFIANNGMDKSGFADYSDDGSDVLPTDDGSVPYMGPPEITCEESGDLGLDLFMKGTVSGVDSYGDFSLSDSCFGDLGVGGILPNLQELSCDPSTNSVVTNTYPCPNGCKDGACIKTAPKPDLIITDVKAEYVAPYTIVSPSYPIVDIIKYTYTIKNQGTKDFVSTSDIAYPPRPYYYYGKVLTLGFMNVSVGETSYFSQELGPGSQQDINQLINLVIPTGQSKDIIFNDYVYSKEFRKITKYKVDLRFIGADYGDDPGYVSELNENNNIFVSPCTTVFRSNPGICTAAAPQLIQTLGLTSVSSSNPTTSINITTLKYDPINYNKKWFQVGILDGNNYFNKGPTTNIPVGLGIPSSDKYLVIKINLFPLIYLGGTDYYNSYQDDHTKVHRLYTVEEYTAAKEGVPAQTIQLVTKEGKQITAYLPALPKNLFFVYGSYNNMYSLAFGSTKKDVPLYVASDGSTYWACKSTSFPNLRACQTGDFLDPSTALNSQNLARAAP